MSQRLLISLKNNIDKEKDGFFDAIFTEDSGLECLLYDWCCYQDGFYLGPWKIVVRDKELMDSFAQSFFELKKFIILSLTLLAFWTEATTPFKISKIPPAKDENSPSF